VQKAILVVDDDLSALRAIERTLRREGYRVLTALEAPEALRLIATEHLDLVITDLRLPRGDGLEVLRKAQVRNPDLPVVMITGYASVEGAVNAMRKGATDYLTKPINLAELRLLVRRTLRSREMAEENLDLRRRLERKYGLEGIVASSPRMQEVLAKVSLLAASDSTVLITGESGTGKELIARALHENGPRNRRPFIGLNCAALPEHLIESELFGYEMGAFTDARERRLGKLEATRGGTLFLDEVGDMSLATQARVLRALEERAVTRLGGHEAIPVDFRLVAASNRDLRIAMEQGRFREDLFYRLSVVTLHLPPLRERRQDIPLLVEVFFKEFSLREGKEKAQLSPSALQALERYEWPGNVRELKNVIESLVVLARRDRIDLEDLSPELRQTARERGRVPIPSGLTMDELEREAILQALRDWGGNRKRAAEALNIGLRTLHRKIRNLGQDTRMPE
jgi:DNA-binding NtrC family response regulator